MTSPLALSGWAAVSALGIAPDAFSEGILTGRTGIRAGGHDGSGLSGVPAGTVPDLDIRQMLGRKNTRAMDRITALAVLTVGRLLDGERAAGHCADGDTTGLVLGTTSGSVQSMMDFTRDSLTRDKPYLVDPARLPNGVMNRPAGQSAIWHGLRGPNSTVATGHVAGLSALRYGDRLVRAGRARTVLCGAVDELTPQRAWLDRRARNHDGSPSLGEGCAVFRLEPVAQADASGRPVLAFLVAMAFRVYATTAQLPAVLGECASAVLGEANASAEEVWAVAADLPEAVLSGLRDTIGDRALWINLDSALGDTGAAAAALHLAALLVRAGAERMSRERLALVASVDRDGVVGVAAFRFPSEVGGSSTCS